MALIVRHTFWDLEEVQSGSGRQRAFTDSCVGDCFDTNFVECSGCDSSTIDTCSTSDRQDSWAFDSSFSSDDDCTPNVPSAKTTIVIRGISGALSQAEFLQIMDSEGLFGTYNFVYLPTDFKKNMRFGYAIVNFISARHAHSALSALDGQTDGGEKGWTIEWSESHQGLDALIDRYRNSTVMHESVADMHKPLVFSQGVRVTFPAPTELLTVPPFQGKKKMSSKKNQGTRKQSKPVDTKLTTVVMRQLSKQLSRSSLRQILDDEGFKGQYDFLYLPVDFAKSVCYGFAIVNFIDPQIANMAKRHFNSISTHSTTVEWSDSHQGLDALIERYRNSKVMDTNVADSHKPILLDRGCVLPFPGPTNP